jgi:alkylation response protein AidB-like acyl-CoA dehydrogenase
MSKAREVEVCESADAVGLPTEAASTLHYEDEAAIIAAARQVGETILGPNAEITDQGAGPNRENFRALADAGLLGLTIPRAYGGLDVSGTTQREVTETLASYCGVTTFTQAQHHGPSRMIYNGPNEALKARVLPELASGRMMCAISFAHLRRPGPPVLSATAVEGGYRVNGLAPWVTGWGLMNQGVFGATLLGEQPAEVGNDRFVYFWLPADRTEFADLFADAHPSDGDWGRMTASAPLPLCAMNASATVELSFDNRFVPAAHRLSESNRETMRRNDRNGVLGATVMPLGCAAGSLRLLCTVAERRNIPAISRTAAALGREWQETRAEIQEWNGRNGDPEFCAHAVRLRAHVIELGVRIAHAAVAATSGAANNRSNPAQRLFREAMFYTVQAQTFEVMDATLELLERAERP